jgi:hypothetical protein
VLKIAKQNIMTVDSLKKLLEKIGDEISSDYHVWLRFLTHHSDSYIKMLEFDEKSPVLGVRIQ